MHQHPPVAIPRWRRIPLREGHPRRRGLAGGQFGDAGGIEGVAQPGGGPHPPTALNHRERPQPGQQQEQHQRHRQRRQQQLGAAPQHHLPAQALPQLQRQQPRQGEQGGQTLQQAARQVGLERGQQPRAEQLQQSHQAPLSDAAGLRQLQGGEHPQADRQGAQRLGPRHRDQGERQQAHGQPSHGHWAKAARQRSRWAAPRPMGIGAPASASP